MYAPITWNGEKTTFTHRSDIWVLLSLQLLPHATSVKATINLLVFTIVGQTGPFRRRTLAFCMMLHAEYKLFTFIIWFKRIKEKQQMGFKDELNPHTKKTRSPTFHVFISQIAYLISTRNCLLLTNTPSNPDNLLQVLMEKHSDWLSLIYPDQSGGRCPL